MIKWFNKNDKSCFATIYPTNITINKAGSEMIKDHYACMIGIDEEKKNIIVKTYSRSDYESGKVDTSSMLLLSGSKSYTRVSSTDFVNEIAELTGKDYKIQPLKYECHYDDSEKYLVIDLNKEVK